MAINFLDPAFANSINQKFRERRFEFFVALLRSVKSDNPIRILDIGGTELYWQRMKFVGDDRVHITLLNLEKVDTKSTAFESIAGDACDLSSFRDGEFDIVFSNSVIEHLFSFDNQVKMANEVRRV